MDELKSILVDIDSSARAHPALERAITLARASGARLTVTDVVDLPAYTPGYLPDRIAEELISRRRQQLARTVDSLSQIDAEAKLLVGRPAIVLIQEVMRSRPDLLMRSHARDLAAVGPKPFGSVDHELLRQCPCPVLLVRHGPRAHHPQVVGAVDASTHDESERVLNAKIAQWTLLMAKLEQGVPTFLQAWKPPGERTVRGHSSDDAFARYVDDVRRSTESDLRHFVQAFGGPLLRPQAACRRGDPESVILDFVVAEGTDLVVMGMVARTGVPGLLIGNTAERVLKTLPCSALAVKPDGFISPVTPDAV